MNQPIISQPMEAMVGLVITIVLGLFVRALLGWALPYPAKPTLMNQEDWDAFTERPIKSDLLGFFERLLSFLAFAISQYVIIGGWFAFKLAAKWETWKNIVQIPTDMKAKGIDPLAWYQARKAFGSWLLSRFLTGTLANVLTGLIGVEAGKLYCKYIGWLCS
jgi:hypothetical protein